VFNTALQEAKEEGLQEGLLEERLLNLQRQRSLLLRLLPRTVGELPHEVRERVSQLTWAQVEALNEVFLEFAGLEDLVVWLAESANIDG